MGVYGVGLVWQLVGERGRLGEGLCFSWLPCGGASGRMCWAFQQDVVGTSKMDFISSCKLLEGLGGQAPCVQTRILFSIPFLDVFTNVIAVRGTVVFEVWSCEKTPYHFHAIRRMGWSGAA